MSAGSCRAGATAGVLQGNLHAAARCHARQGCPLERSGRAGAPVATRLQVVTRALRCSSEGGQRRMPRAARTRTSFGLRWHRETAARVGYAAPSRYCLWARGRSAQNLARAGGSRPRSGTWQRAKAGSKSSRLQNSSLPWKAARSLTLGNVFSGCTRRMGGVAHTHVYYRAPRSRRTP